MTPAFLTYALQTSAAVSVLILLVLLIRKPVAHKFGATAAYALWLLPALRLVMPPLAQNWSLWESFKVATPPISIPTSTTISTIPSLDTGITTNKPAEILPEIVPYSIIENSVSPISQINWSFVTLSVWATGMLLVLSYTIWQQRRFMGVIAREGRPAPTHLQTLTDRIAMTLSINRKVRVRQSLISKTPMVTGTVNPVIILPEWFEADYTKDEQIAAISHELMHVKRHDLWALYAAYLAYAVQWFNPLAHYALKTFRADQEAACDASVMGTGTIAPHAYGATLVKAVKLALPQPQFALAAGLPPRHDLKGRLLQLQTPLPTTKTKLLGTSMITSLGIAGLLITACTTATSADEIEVTQEDTEFHVISHKKTLYENGGHQYTDEECEEEKEINFSKIKIKSKTDGSSAGHHKLIINGHEIKDRRIVLLSDPFQDLHPELAKLKGMEAPEFSMPEIEIPDHEMPEPPEPPEAPNVETSVINGRTHIIIDSNEEEMRKFEIRMEKHSAEVEKIAAKHEKVAREYEKRVERIMGAGLKDSLSLAGKTLNKMTQACINHTFDNAKLVILTEKARIDGKNRRYKTLCISGAHTDLHTAEIEKFVKTSPDLTAEEKSKFFESRDQTITLNFKE